MNVTMLVAFVAMSYNVYDVWFILFTDFGHELSLILMEIACPLWNSCLTFLVQLDMLSVVLKVTAFPLSLFGAGLPL